jgi:uncharacterized membrane protein
MEPITLLGAVIVVFGLWVEFEPVIIRAVRALSSSIRSALATSAPVQKPVYVKYMTGSGT